MLSFRLSIILKRQILDWLNKLKRLINYFQRKVPHHKKNNKNHNIKINTRNETIYHVKNK